MTQRFLATLLVSLLLLLSGGLALAAVGEVGGGGGGDRVDLMGGGDSGTLKNPIEADTFEQFITAVLRVAIQILWPFVVLAFIYAGFMFVRAQGNPEEIQHAKTAMIYSVIGAFILFAAYGFTKIIESTVKNVTGFE